MRGAHLPDMPSRDPSARALQQQQRRMCKLAVDAIAAGCPGGHSIEDIDIENLTLQSHGVHVPPITGAASASAVDERFFIKLRFASDSGAASEAARLLPQWHDVVERQLPSMQPIVFPVIGQLNLFPQEQPARLARQCRAGRARRLRSLPRPCIGHGMSASAVPAAAAAAAAAAAVAAVAAI